MENNGSSRIHRVWSVKNTGSGGKQWVRWNTQGLVKNNGSGGIHRVWSVKNTGSGEKHVVRWNTQGLAENTGYSKMKS